jgi:putative transposase
MKASRFSEEQVIKALREQESKRKTVLHICKEMGSSQGTFFKWKQKYGGMTVSEAKRLRVL